MWREQMASQDINRKNINMKNGHWLSGGNIDESVDNSVALPEVLTISRVGVTRAVATTESSPDAGLLDVFTLRESTIGDQLSGAHSTTSSSCVPSTSTCPLTRSRPSAM